jgi:hypothetical protein
MKSFNVLVRRIPNDPGEALRISLMTGPSLRTVTTFSVLGPAPILNNFPAEAKAKPTITNEKTENKSKSANRLSPSTDWKVLIIDWFRLTPLNEITIQVMRSASHVKGKSRKTFNPSICDIDPAKKMIAYIGIMSTMASIQARAFAKSFPLEDSPSLD